MLQIDLYPNKNQDSEQYGKIYGRVHNATPIDLEALAKHMSEHNSPYSRGVIMGVLTDMVSCIKELILQGQPVKIADLAIFKAAVTSKAALNVEKFTIQEHIKEVRLLAVATGIMSIKEMTADGSIGYTTLAQKIKNGEATLSMEKGKYLTSDSGSGGGGGTPAIVP